MLLLFQAAKAFLNSPSRISALFPKPFYLSWRRLLRLLHQLCDWVNDNRVIYCETPLSFKDFLDTEKEHTKTSNISEAQTFLNTMLVFVHDPNDRMDLAEVRMLRRDKRNVKSVGMHICPGPVGTGPVLAIALLPHSGRTLCKRIVLHEVITQNDEDRAPQQPQRKNGRQSIGKQRIKRVIPTPSGTTKALSGSLIAQTTPPEQIFVSHYSSEPHRRHRVGFEALR